MILAALVTFIGVSHYLPRVIHFARALLMTNAIYHIYLISSVARRRTDGTDQPSFLSQNAVRVPLKPSDGLGWPRMTSEVSRKCLRSDPKCLGSVSDCISVHPPLQVLLAIACIGFMEVAILQKCAPAIQIQSASEAPPPPPRLHALASRRTARLLKEMRPFLATPRLHASAHHGAPSCPQVRPFPRKAAPRARTRIERTPHPETLANGLDAEVHHWRPVCAHHGACDRGLRVQPMARRRAGPVLACTCPSRRPGSPCTFGRRDGRLQPTNGRRRAGRAPCRASAVPGRAPCRESAVPGGARVVPSPSREIASRVVPSSRLHLESSPCSHLGRAATWE